MSDIAQPVPNGRIEAALRNAEAWVDKHTDELGVTDQAGGIIRQLVSIIAANIPSASSHTPQPSVVIDTDLLSEPTDLDGNTLLAPQPSTELIAEAERTLAQHDRVWANTSNNPLPTRGVSASLRALIEAVHPNPARPEQVTTEPEHRRA